MRARNGVLMVCLALALACQATAVVAADVEGTVTVGGKPVSGATVTLWKTAGTEAPESVAEVSTDGSGGFKIRHHHGKADGNVFYLTTEGGAGDGVAPRHGRGQSLRGKACAGGGGGSGHRLRGPGP